MIKSSFIPHCAKDKSSCVLLWWMLSIYKAYKYVFSKISQSLESHLDSSSNYLKGDPLHD